MLMSQCVGKKNLPKKMSCKLEVLGALSIWRRYHVTTMHAHSSRPTHNTKLVQIDMFTR